MRLDVPLYRQEKNSEDCGIVCAQMILDFHGKKKSVTSIKTDIQVYDEGTYAPQIGLYFLKNGFDVNIITLHPGLFTLHDIGSTDDAIFQRIVDSQKMATSDFDVKALKYFTEYLDAGGKITPKIPDETDIVKSIESGNPLIALLTSHFLTETDPNFFFHFNVVTGIADNTVYRNDPLYDDRGGKKESNVNDFFYGVFASTYGGLDNGSLIQIAKR